MKADVYCSGLWAFTHFVVRFGLSYGELLTEAGQFFIKEGFLRDSVQKAKFLFINSKWLENNKCCN